MFFFKQFHIDDAGCGMKICTDSVMLGAWAQINPGSRVLDIGTGSGLLALMLAQRAPEAQIIGVEKDEGAADAARLNFSCSPWSSRLEAVCADIFEYPEEKAFDLIVCNPPYFFTGLLSPDATRATARHGSDGLNPLSVLSMATRLLAPGGSLAMVTPADGEDDIIFAAEMQHLHLSRLCRVRTVPRKSPTRLLWQFALASDSPLEITEMSIRLPSGGYSPEYVDLTSPFYLNF